MTTPKFKIGDLVVFDPDNETIAKMHWMEPPYGYGHKYVGQFAEVTGTTIGGTHVNLWWPGLDEDSSYKADYLKKLKPDP